MHAGPPTCTLFPYTTLFRSGHVVILCGTAKASLARRGECGVPAHDSRGSHRLQYKAMAQTPALSYRWRSEEHTSELQSRRDLVCRLLLEKKKPSKPARTAAA